MGCRMVIIIAIIAKGSRCRFSASSIRWGTDKLKKEVSTDSEMYIPPAMAINSVKALEKGDSLISSDTLEKSERLCSCEIFILTAINIRIMIIIRIIKLANKKPPPPVIFLLE